MKAPAPLPVCGACEDRRCVDCFNLATEETDNPLEVQVVPCGCDCGGGLYSWTWGPAR